MATTVRSSSNHQSPRGSGFSGDGAAAGIHSPQFQRGPLPSAWAEVVRGEPESIPAVHLSPTSSSLTEQTPFTDCSSMKDAATAAVTSTDDQAAEECSDEQNGNAAQPKKPVWNKLSNGVVEVGPVMGAEAWPALSESTRASSKSLAADTSSKPVSNGPIPVSQGPVIPNAPQKQVTSSNSNPTSRHALPARQRSMKRGTDGTGGGRPAQSGFSHPPPPPPPFPVFEFSQGNYGNFLPVPPREPPFTTRPIAEFSPSHAVNDQFSHRNSTRRPRGEGQYHNNSGGRRDHDRRNPEMHSWSSNGRDLHMQHQRAPPVNFMRPSPPGSPTFITPPPVRPFASSVGFTDMRHHPLFLIPTLHPVPFRGMPFVTHAPSPPMYFSIQDTSLSTLLVNQIDYYFSDVNLETDNYLKSNMDEQGWVAITVIASFPRVMKLTSDIQIILEALRTSMVVELKDGKIRRRNEWMKYVRPTGQGSTVSNSQSLSGSSDNELTTNLQKLTLGEGSSKQSSIMAMEETTCSYEESIGGLHPSNDEVTN